MFEQFFSQGQKVITVFVGRLTGPQCFNYHGMYKKITIVCLQQLFSTQQKNIAVF